MTALVTGAARGIGFATARKLVEVGHEVVVADINGDAAAEAASRIGAKAIALDVSDPDSVAAAAAGFDTLDVLVNNAGIVRGGTLGAMSVADYRAVMDVNVLGPILMTQAFTEALAAVRGAVVNLASMSSFMPVPGTGVYSMSKAAVLSYTQGVALELAPRGIRVNAVAPGRISTEMTADRQTDPAREARTNGLIPLGRSGQAEDVAEVIAWLASPAAAYVTGQVIPVDGGLTIATVPFFQAAQGTH